MIIIQVGDSSREYHSIRAIEEGWVLQQIADRRKAGEQISVRVSIRQSPLDIALTAPRVAGGGGGGRQANEEELKAFALWNDCGLNSHNFEPGRLIEFLKKVAKLLR